MSVFNSRFSESQIIVSFYAVQRAIEEQNQLIDQDLEDDLVPLSRLNVAQHLIFERFIDQKEIHERKWENLTRKQAQLTEQIKQVHNQHTKDYLSSVSEGCSEKLDKLQSRISCYCSLAFSNIKFIRIVDDLLNRNVALNKSVVMEALDEIVACKRGFKYGEQNIDWFIFSVRSIVEAVGESESSLNWARKEVQSLMGRFESRRVYVPIDELSKMDTLLMNMATSLIYKIKTDRPCLAKTNEFYRASIGNAFEELGQAIDAIIDGDPPVDVVPKEKID